MRIFSRFLFLILACHFGTAHAAEVAPTAVAKQVFGAMKTPAPLEARAIGNYARGCLAGGQALAVNGTTWQVMRLSRNRNWAHPHMISFMEDLAAKVPQVSRWPGLLVGDMSQPRGGPMLTGHASHQVGLDADVWLTPMPTRILSREEREEMSAVNMVRQDRLDVSPAWRDDHLPVIRSAAQHPQVERILVNAAIKKALCREATGDRRWLQKIRPYYGHDHHFHVRLSCPQGDDTCAAQDPVVPGEGCGEALDYWFSDAVLNPPRSTKPSKPKPPLTIGQLPAECRMVVGE